HPRMAGLWWFVFLPVHALPPRTVLATARGAATQGACGRARAPRELALKRALPDGPARTRQRTCRRRAPCPRTTPAGLAAGAGALLRPPRRDPWRLDRPCLCGGQRARDLRRPVALRSFWSGTRLVAGPCPGRIPGGLRPQQEPLRTVGAHVIAGTGLRASAHRSHAQGSSLAAGRRAGPRISPPSGRLVPAADDIRARAARRV